MSNHGRKHNITIHSKVDGIEGTWKSEGDLLQHEDELIIEYPDYTSNTETDNKLIINSKNMRLIRTGAITSDMTFEENMTKKGVYSVMFFDSAIQVITKSYQLDIGQENITIEVDYQIYDGDNELADNWMRIIIEKKD